MICVKCGKEMRATRVSSPADDYYGSMHGRTSSSIQYECDCYRLGSRTPITSTPFKVIVAGSREFSDYNHLERTLDHLLAKRLPNVEIVSGKARGADTLGETYARKRGLQVKEFPADWNTHGRAAGYIRNKEMADYADACVVFWDGESKGSKHMIDLALDKEINVRVIKY